MDNNFIGIEEFAKIVNKSTSTIRRSIKNLSEKDKNRFIRRVPVVGSGGEKILLAKAWIDNFAKHEQPNERLENEELNENIVEILSKQITIKDGQISDLSNTNKELLERLKEVNYTVATLQKQLSAPVSDEQTKPLKWWQFWE